MGNGDHSSRFLGILKNRLGVKDAKIYLEFDPVVEQSLDSKEICLRLKEVVLDRALRHVNLTAHEH